MGLKRKLTALEKVNDVFKNDLLQVQELMVKTLDSDLSIINNISNHIINSGGKRLRSILTLSSASLCGYKGDLHIELAVAIEFFHTATLLHDDVVDNSSIRRGKATASSVWGNKESILVGDYLLGKSFDLIGKSGMIDVYKIISKAAVVISEGEFLQLQNVSKIIEDENIYYNIITAKTAILFASACQIGGEIATSSESVKQNLYLYGLNLGMAFQIVDDILDYTSNKNVIGKNIGEDFLDKKTTLPLIIAYKDSNAEERKFWERTICKGDQKEGDFLKAVDIINKYNAIERSVEKAKVFIDKARQSLAKFEDSDIKSLLNEILDFAIERIF